MARRSSRNVAPGVLPDQTPGKCLVNASSPTSGLRWPAPWPWAAVIALVVAAAWLAWWPVLLNDLVYDDTSVVKENPGLPRLLSFRPYFSHSYFLLSTETTYRPLVTLSYALDYAWAGQNPLGYHVTNLLWHSLACVLFLVACRGVGTPLSVAAIGGVLYASHPVMSEAVCSVGYREDLMCAAFYLAAFALWPVEGTGGRRERLRYCASLFLFVLAALSKEMALTFPILAMAKEWRAWRLAGLSARAKARKARVARVAPWFVAAWILAFSLFALLTISAFPSEGVTNTPPPSNASLFQRSAGFAYICLRYLRLFVAPYPLLAEYEIPMAGTGYWLKVSGSVAILMAFGALAWWKRRRFPYALDAFVAFFLLSGPVSNVVSLPHPMALRYVYLPFAALCWLAAHVLATVPMPKRRIAVTGALAMGAVVLSWNRALDWRSEKTLWSSEIRHSSAPGIAYANLGYAFLRANDPEQAVKSLSKSVELRPDYAVARNNLGAALQRLGRVDEATREYAEAVRVNPDNVTAQFNLGSLLYNAGHVEEAIAHITRAVQIRPDYADAQFALGRVLALRGNLAEAASHLAETVRYAPDFAEGHDQYGRVLSSLGRYNEAVDEYRAALLSLPDDATLHLNLGIALAGVGRVDEAFAQGVEAARLSPTDLQIRCALGDLFLKLEKIPQAIEQYRAALPLAQAAGETALTSQILEILGRLK